MKPTLIYLKNIEKTTNKIRLPKEFVEKHGDKYYMEIYQDKIILRPIIKKEEWWKNEKEDK